MQTTIVESAIPNQEVVSNDLLCLSTRQVICAGEIPVLQNFVADYKRVNLDNGLSAKFIEDLVLTEEQQVTRDNTTNFLLLDSGFGTKNCTICWATQDNLEQLLDCKQ